MLYLMAGGDYMLRNKKLVIFIFLIILILSIILSFSILFICPRIKYSLQNVQNLLISQKDMSNIYINKETIQNDKIIYDNEYVKDGFIYNVSKDSFQQTLCESFYNPDTNEKIVVLNNENKILMSKSFEDMILSEASNFINLSQNSNYHYKYIGKENINGNKCLKVSLTNSLEDKISIDYYYIDLESKYIIKNESYEGSDLNNLEKTLETNYTYINDVVVDADIYKFDTNNYINFEYIH